MKIYRLMHQLKKMGRPNRTWTKADHLKFIRLQAAIERLQTLRPEEG